jgi:hypothetical protein
MRHPAVALAAALVVLVATAGATPASPALSPSPSTAGSAAGPASPAAVTAPPVHAAVPAQVAPPNTTAVLLLGDAERGAVHSPGADLSAALDTDRAVTDERLARERLRERYGTAAPDERAAVLNDALDRAVQRAASLNAAETRLQRGYANDTRSAAELARGLAHTDATARALDTTLTFVDARADDSPPLRSRVSEIRRDLSSIRGPVRDRMSAAINGDENVSRVYLAGTESGVRLATIDDGVHYHESSRPAPRADGDVSTTIDEAERRVAELYPWAWNASQGTTVDVVGSDTYRATIEHPHGTLVSYVDASSLEVVREIQRRDVAELPTGPAVSTARGDLRVAVNRTYPGGPLRVAVSDGAEETNTIVRVDDAVVGQTGPDGVLWTVSPDGGPDSRFIVTAERGDEQVSLIVQPTRNQPSGA